MALLLEGIGDGWAVVRRSNGKPELLLFGSLEELRRVITRALAKAEAKAEAKVKPIMLPRAIEPTDYDFPLEPLILLSDPRPVTITETVLPSDVDCRTCGACCAPLDQNKKVHPALEEEDVDRLPGFMKNVLVVREGGRPYIRTKCVDGITVCSAFSGVIGGRGKCGIYSKRPIACQVFEKGSLECLEARAARGVGANNA